MAVNDNINLRRARRRGPNLASLFSLHVLGVVRANFWPLRMRRAAHLPPNHPPTFCISAHARTKFKFPAKDASTALYCSQCSGVIVTGLVCPESSSSKGNSRLCLIIALIPHWPPHSIDSGWLTHFACTLVILNHKTRPVSPHLFLSCISRADVP